MPGPFLTVPNLLSLARLAAGPLIVWLIGAGEARVGLYSLIAAGLTDVADGLLARRFGWSSRVGEWLDPVADKVLAASVFLALGWAGAVPWWLVGLVFGRDVLILLAAACFVRFTPVRKFTPSVWGKLSTFCQVALAGFAIGDRAYPQVGVAPVAGALVWVAAAATLWSGVHYFARAARLVAGLLVAVTLSAQIAYLPLKDVRAGMKGTGRTVFAGSRIEEFGVEVLGVLENAGPRQSIILARLSGAGVERAGVAQGMSGSPVFLDGKLAGAVALAFPFAKEPICGIRPIEDMTRSIVAAPPRASRAAVTPWEYDPVRSLAAEGDGTVARFGESRLVEIATPVSFTGMTARTLEQFGPGLRALGLEPRQGVSGGGSAQPRMGDPRVMAPGSMISVQLLSGDMAVGADGTITHIDGNRVYGFGHRFMAIGPADLPFARAEVLTVLPSVASSFKISTARELMGTITSDRSTGVSGELGRRARTVPLEIAVRARGAKTGGVRYRMEMVRDPVLSPLLVQMATFSAIDATERSVGNSSFVLRGEIRFTGGVKPVRVSNMFAGDTAVPLLVSVGASAPLAFAVQSGFDSLKLAGVSLEVESIAEKRQMQISQFWTGRKEARPGDEIELTVGLNGDNGEEVVRRAVYRVPVGAPAGPLHFTVSDAVTANFTEYRQLLTTPPRSAAQVLSILNGLRSNSKAYIRVWRSEGDYQVEGEDLPSAPPSLALILARSGGQVFGRGSRLAEIEIGVPDAVVAGSKTIQVDVKN